MIGNDYNSFMGIVKERCLFDNAPKMDIIGVHLRVFSHLDPAVGGKELLHAERLYPLAR